MDPWRNVVAMRLHFSSRRRLNSFLRELQLFNIIDA